MQLSQLVQQLRFRLVDGKLFPLDVYRSGCISLSRQQHSRFLLIETEENRPRLEFLRRRRVGVVGHGLEKVTLVAEPLRRFFGRQKERRKVLFMLTDRRASVTADVLLPLQKRPHVVESRRGCLTSSLGVNFNLNKDCQAKAGQQDYI